MIRQPDDSDFLDGAAPPAPGRVMRVVIWSAGLLVAVGAAVATAHGLYEVALAARVPAAIAWLYPLITDGLALVAYASSARLSGPAARYAWSVVVLAAGLSGLAQAMFLASDTPATDAGLPHAAGAAGGDVVVGPVFEASAALRFGVGAWPAVAAAIVAHLLYLLATDHPDPTATADPAARAVHLGPSNPAGVQPEPSIVQPGSAAAVHSSVPGPVQRHAEVPALPGRPALVAASVEQPDRRSGGSPARDRAWAAASRHAHRHGALPTVTDLAAAAEVSRGTAAAVLKHLRTQSTPLHLIPSDTDQPDPSEHEDDPTIEKATQP